MRPPLDNKPGNNPMGGSKNYKDAFKTPGYTDFKGSNVVDVAHCKVCGQYDAFPNCLPPIRGRDLRKVPIRE